VLLLGLAVLGWSFAVKAQQNAAAGSEARHVPAPPNTQSLPSQRVTFTTDEKAPITIAGTFTPARTDDRNSRAPMAVLLHMYGEDRSSFTPLVPALHRAGFAVLAVDLRGHGESVEPASLKLRQKVEDRDPRLFREMDRDVEAAYHWLIRRPDVAPARFVLVGASVGASVALDYAARDKSVDGLVLMTPGLEYRGLNSKASARKLVSRPVLMLTAEHERGAADELAAEITGAKVQIVGQKPAGGDSMALHGTRMLGQVAGVEDMIAEFLTAAAGRPSDAPVVASVIGEVYYEPGSRRAERLSPDNLRRFSSAAEAEARGYRPPKRRRR